MHDGRVSPWTGENNSIVIQKNSNQLSRFESVLRNGIISSKFVFLFFKKKTKSFISKDQQMSY